MELIMFSQFFRIFLLFVEIIILDGVEPLAQELAIHLLLLFLSRGRGILFFTKNLFWEIFPEAGRIIRCLFHQVRQGVRLNNLQTGTYPAGHLLLGQVPLQGLIHLYLHLLGPIGVIIHNILVDYQKLFEDLYYLQQVPNQVEVRAAQHPVHHKKQSFHPDLAVAVLVHQTQGQHCWRDIWIVLPRYLIHFGAWLPLVKGEAA